MNYKDLANQVLDQVGGPENITSVTHCMTRLRFRLKDRDIALDDAIKKTEGVVGVVYKGGQYQVIIGPEVGNVYDELIKAVPHAQSDGGEIKQADTEKQPFSLKGLGNEIMGALAACMTPLIPILLCAGFSRTIVAIFGPQLFNVISETSSLYILFTFVGDAGFYFMPVFVGYTAAKRFGVNVLMGIFMGAILIHPTLIQMATSGVSFDIYGIPSVVQNYSTTIIPIILTVWLMSYVEQFFKKYTPNVLKVFGVPFGTMLVMLPIMLCVVGPLGSFIGKYVCEGIIALHGAVGPLAVAIVGATFGLLVLTGMHTLLMAFLFLTFPMLGYDAFILPAILCCSWAGGGVTIACFFKFKNKAKKSLVLGYFLTWLLGGVGEPLAYGLNIPYKTPMVASIISGFLAGLVGGLMGLKAYVLAGSNGIYGLAAFVGGPTSNYIALGVTLVASVVIGFVVMWFMKLDESLVS